MTGVSPRYNSSLYYLSKSWRLYEGAKLTDANATLLVSAGSLRVQDSAFTNNRVIRLSASGAADNEGFEVQKRVRDGFTLTVLDDATSAVLYVFPGSDLRASDFIFDLGSGAWAAGGNVAIREV